MNASSDNWAKENFENVMDLMVQAGWLRSYTLTDGKGYHLNWLEKGSIAAMKLSQWARSLNILATDERAQIICELAVGRTVNPASNGATINNAITPLVQAGFADRANFREREGAEIIWTPAGLAFCDELAGCLTDLHLPNTEDHTLVLFHIAEGWAPDMNTPVKFY